MGKLKKMPTLDLETNGKVLVELQATEEKQPAASSTRPRSDRNTVSITFCTKNVLMLLKIDNHKFY